MHTRNSGSILITVLLLSSFWMAGPVFAQGLAFTSYPVGYTQGSIALPRESAGAMATIPDGSGNLVFVAVGAWQDNQLACVDLANATSWLVASGPFGSIGGIAPLSATQVVLVDNGSAAGGPPDQTILLATDGNADGDFDDLGEIVELITPILTGAFGWTGAQAIVVPDSEPAGLPAGSILIQTADGGGAAELLVVTDPLGTPGFRPAGQALYSGFDYNGGIDFDSQGNILMGTALDSFAGSVYALQNTNADEVIDPAEANLVLSATDLPLGISGLTLDGEDDGFLATGGKVVQFDVPSAVLTETASVAEFFTTNSFFLNGIALNRKDAGFEPFGGSGGAVLLVSGFGEANLLTLTPSEPLTEFSLTSPVTGYEESSLNLPRNFAGGVGIDVFDPDLIYVSVGNYQDNNLVRVNLDTGEVEFVAYGPFGSIGGIAPLSATQVVLIDNADAPGGPPGNTILLASDENGDGDFDDSGEISELIAPILTGFFGFSGAQAHIAPPGVPGIPAGSLVIQTADGGGEGELLVVREPLGTPAFYPVGGSFFTGFDYNGGFAFDSNGRLVMGTATGSFTGEVHLLEDTDASGQITAAEQSPWITDTDLPFGISDLTIAEGDQGFCCSSGAVKSFSLSGAPEVTNFAETDSFFLSAVRINDNRLPFVPGAGARAKLLVGSGMGHGNLLVLTPELSTAVENWNLY